MNMRTCDFFSGLGGFTYGAQSAGADVVLAANHNSDAIAWHESNHPEIQHVEQDLGELDMRALPDHELLVASPCCQGFTPSGRPGQSTAHRVNRDRVLANRQVARNTCYAVLAAADVARPQRIIVENVVQFLEWCPHERCKCGLTFKAWLGMLESHGYTARVHRILASDYGSAQDRERAIITAALDGPIELAPTWGNEARAIGDCLLEDGDERCRWQPIDSKTRKSKFGTMRERMRRVQDRFGTRVTWANVDSAIGRSESDHFPTLTTRSLSQTYLLDGDRCRMLEARELARAMSLPDSYKIPEGLRQRTVADRLIGNMIDCRVSQGVVEQVLAA